MADDTLRHIAQLPALTSLDLRSQYRITAHGIAHLAPLSATLRTLKLAYCGRLGNESLPHLARLEALRFLDLTWCHSVSDLFLLAPLTNLEVLLLSNDGRDRTTQILPPSLVNLTSLDLCGRRPSSWPTVDGETKLSCISPLRSLRHLKLRSSGCVNNDAFRNISQCTMLTTLDMSYMHKSCDDVDLSPLLSLHNLRTIEFVNWTLSNENLRDLSKLLGLRHLCLRGCKTSDDGPQVLSSLARLEMFEPPQQFVTAQWLLPFMWLSSITFQQSNMLTNASFQEHMTPARFPCLEKIAFYGCKGVTTQILEHFAVFPRLTTFVSHYVGDRDHNGAAADDDVCCFSRLPLMSSLTTLTVRHSSLTSEMMFHILRATPSLTQLDISECSEVDVMALEPLLSNGDGHHLTSLVFDYNSGVTDVCVENIALFSRLQTLSLQGSDMTYVAPLAQLRELRHLDVRWCRNIVDLGALDVPSIRQGVHDHDDDD